MRWGTLLKAAWLLCERLTWFLFSPKRKKEKSDDMFFGNMQPYFQTPLTPSQETRYQRGKQHLCCSLMGRACPLRTRVSCRREPGRAGPEGAAAALPCLDGCPKRSLKHLRIHCSVMPWVPGSFGKVLMQNIMG